MRFKLCLSTLLFLFSFLFSQDLPATEKIKIIKIADTNLLLLEDGRQICFASLKMPSRKDTSKAQQIIAQMILEYETKHLLNHDVRIEISPNSQPGVQPIPVHVLVPLPLQKLNINKEFLKNGYAFYQPIDTLYQEAYERAAQLAKNKKRNIWSPKQVVFRKKGNLFFGINGARGYFVKSEFQERDDVHILEAMVHFTKPALFGGIQVRLGKMRIREKGFSFCEAGPAIHYAVDALYNYLILNTQMNSKYFGIGFGFFYLNQTKRGFCQEVWDDFAVPIASLRLGNLKKMYLSANLLNDIFELWKVGVHYRLDKSFSEIWIGYIRTGNSERIYNNPKNSAYIALGGQYLFFNRFLFNLSGQIMPSSSNKFVKMGLSVKLK